MTRLPRSDVKRHVGLTDRQREILALIDSGVRPYKLRSKFGAEQVETAMDKREMGLK